MLIHRNGAVEEVDTETFFALNRGDEVEVFVTGGGGFGDPLRRDRTQVADDVADGIVSREQARAAYGWKSG